MASIHYGSLLTLSNEATDGLRFLKSFLPKLDSLDPSETKTLQEHITPSAKFIINGEYVATAIQIEAMMKMRAGMLSRFAHKVDISWDVPRSQHERTVMYESTSVTVFKDDKEERELCVREFNIIELELQTAGSWRAVELRTFMDTSAVAERRRQLEGDTKN